MLQLLRQRSVPCLALLLVQRLCSWLVLAPPAVVL